MSNLEKSLSFGTFITYINNFDVFFLFETHVISDRQLYFSSFFKNYSLHWIAATKVHKAGRASGGCLYGFKKEIQKKFSLKFITVNSNVVLSAKFSDDVYYFIPRYLNCTNWKSDLESFEIFLDAFSPSNFCIVGDLNARIGEEQYIDQNELLNLPHICNVRCSKDKTINWQGRRLMDVIDKVGGIVLNGRTVNDAQGDYSFCGVMGSSVIDYCICSYNFLQLVDNFSVASKPYSDHMPLCLRIKIPIHSSENKMGPVFRKHYWNGKLTDQYRRNLSRDQLFETNTSVDDMVHAIKTKIKRANVRKPGRTFFKPRQKWFDWKCFRFHSVMQKKLHEFRRKHTAINRSRFLSSRSDYLEVCSLKKLQYQNDNLMMLDKVTCSKDWWNISNSLKSRKYLPNGNLDADDFYLHFSSMLRNQDDVQVFSWCMPCIVDSVLDSPIEPCELYAVVKNLKLNKSPGSDGIPYEFYKYAPPCLVNQILFVFNKIFLLEKVPLSFRQSILIPLYKKGDPNLVTNYRGLSLIDTLCKIFNSILLNRISDWLSSNNILNEFQAGFRREYSTVDNIFNLVSIVNLNKLSGKYTYAFFVDFSCAFDTISRNSLFYKLSCIGLSSKIIRVLQSLYDTTESRVWDGSMFSDYFAVETGVKQGCILSPMLFSLYINDLPDILPGGLNVAGIDVKILLYADDIVILSNTPNGLQDMIDALQGYCLRWSLRVNLLKSKIMVFRKGTRISQNLKWHYGEANIEIVNNYVYLGVDITYNLSFRSHLRNKLSASKVAISSTWSKYINNPKISKANKLKIFDAASKSIMFYAAQIWGYEKYDDVEKLFRFFIKKMLFLPANTPNYMLYLETGFSSLYISSLKLHFSYVNRVLSLSPNRLPRILAEAIIRMNVFWAREWVNLCNVVHFSPPDNDSPVCLYWKEILSLLVIQERNNFTIDASNSQFHDLYSQLDYSVTPSLTTEFSARATSLIIRARGGLLDLNARCFKNNTNGICTICNMHESENTFHFIGICPIYGELRRRHFGHIFLDYNEVINILNGNDFNSLYLYLESCLKFRNLIMKEFDV